MKAKLTWKIVAARVFYSALAFFLLALALLEVGLAI